MTIKELLNAGVDIGEDVEVYAEYVFTFIDAFIDACKSAAPELYKIWAEQYGDDDKDPEEIYYDMFKSNEVLTHYRDSFVIAIKDTAYKYGLDADDIYKILGDKLTVVGFDTLQGDAVVLVDYVN